MSLTRVSLPQRPGRPGGPRRLLRRRGLAPVAVAVLALTGCSLMPRPPFDDSRTAVTPDSLPERPTGPALRVLVFGDHGTGDEGQREVAEAVARVHGDAPPALVLTVGDNFYPDGVSGPEDPLWEEAFSRVYTGPFWDSLTFHPTLGNHDHRGDPDAQVAYSELDRRWSMPARRYAFRREIPGGGTAQFVALDTDQLLRDDSTGVAHARWVDSTLADPDPAWTIVYGHHPLASGGPHRVSGTLTRQLLPLLPGRVPLYLAGHSHSTELIRLEPGLLQGVCGGGGGGDNPYRVVDIPGTLAAFSNGGWCTLHIQPRTLTVELYNRVGTLRHREVIRRPPSPDGESPPPEGSAGP